MKIIDIFLRDAIALYLYIIVNVWLIRLLCRYPNLGIFFDYIFGESLRASDAISPKVADDSVQTASRLRRLHQVGVVCRRRQTTQCKCTIMYTSGVYM